MNFNLLLFLICSFAFGCGVKAKPSSPPDKAISSYVESITGTPFEDKKDNPKKK